MLIINYIKHITLFPFKHIYYAEFRMMKFNTIYLFKSSRAYNSI
jgi:hypothetical protein